MQPPRAFRCAPTTRPYAPSPPPLAKGCATLGTVVGSIRTSRLTSLALGGAPPPPTHPHPHPHTARAPLAAVVHLVALAMGTLTMAHLTSHQVHPQLQGYTHCGSLLARQLVHTYPAPGTAGAAGASSRSWTVAHCARSTRLKLLPQGGQLAAGAGFGAGPDSKALFTVTTGGWSDGAEDAQWLRGDSRLLALDGDAWWQQSHSLRQLHLWARH